MTQFYSCKVTRVTTCKAYTTANSLEEAKEKFKDKKHFQIKEESTDNLEFDLDTVSEGVT